MKFTTFTGKIVDLSNFTQKMVCLEDIAHHLTKICRFGGALALDCHYSVAQHSFELVEYLERQGEYNTIVLASALLHDASECYLGDVISPLKKLLPDYKGIEQIVMNTIFTKYLGYYPKESLKKIKKLDKSIVVDEAIAFNPLSVPLFTKRNRCKGLQERLNIGITTKSMKQVKQHFLNWCNKLGLKDE